MATAKSLTIKQAQEAFGIAHMTLHNWRQGTATKEALPATTGENGRVSIRLGDLKTWAKRHGVEFATDPAKIIERDEAKAAKRVKH